MLFFLPAALDTAVIVMSAREREWFWAFPLLATLGSLIGAAVTYAIGGKIGEAGLKRWIPERRLKNVRHRLGTSGVVAMGVMALLPPPFPLTPFVLTSGALKLEKGKFFLTLAAARVVRFGVVSVLALVYGRRILSWLESDVFGYVISALMILAITGTAITVVEVFRRAR